MGLGSIPGRAKIPQAVFHGKKKKKNPLYKANYMGVGWEGGPRGCMNMADSLVLAETNTVL